MVNASDIREHMEVIGSDGGHIGMVDRVEGDRIKLTKNDPSSGGQHHYVDVGMVASIEQDKVRLLTTAIAAQEQWQTEGHQPGTSSEAF